ncbi:transposase family protein [Streptomyces yanii]|uniref:Transposase family protein n=1 Tax=Streptomyces yanii TaxID=78510 RepID=A0ABV5RKT3_9ACTN
MDVAIDTTRLLGLDGQAVVGVADDTDGPVVHLVTADERARHCPDCGTRARRPRDLSVGGRRPRLVWAKRRWRCDELASLAVDTSMPANFVEPAPCNRVG